MKLFMLILGINALYNMETLTTFECLDIESVSFPNRDETNRTIKVKLYSICLQTLISNIIAHPTMETSYIQKYIKDEPNIVEKLKSACLTCLPEDLFE